MPRSARTPRIIALELAIIALAAAIDDLAGALEASTAGATAVQLPHKLGVHEQPHWPTEMAIAAIGL